MWLSLQFVVEDDQKPLAQNDENEDRQRFSSDRREQTQQLRDQQGQLRYESEKISHWFENLGLNCGRGALKVSTWV